MRQSEFLREGFKTELFLYRFVRPKKSGARRAQLVKIYAIFVPNVANFVLLGVVWNDTERLSVHGSA